MRAVVPAAMSELARRLVDGTLSPPDFIERCLRLISETIDCRCAGLCLFIGAPPNRLLRSIRAYDRSTGGYVRLPDEAESHVAAYFAAFDGIGFVVAPDVDADPRLARLFEGAGRELGVTSYMASAFSVNGRLLGALTCFDIGRHVAWTARQLALLSSFSSAATLALARETGGRLARIIEELDVPLHDAAGGDVDAARR